MSAEFGRTTPNGNGAIEAPQAIIADFQRLIQRGQEILHVCGWDGKHYAAFMPGGIEVLKFRAQTLGLIHRVFGADSRHHKTLQTYALERRAAEHGYRIREFLDVLEDAHREYSRANLFTAPDQLLADLGNDMIELAEVLANAGFHLAAAHRAGIVLEGVMHRLADARGVCDTGTSSLIELNDALARAKAYDDATHRRIGAWLRIRLDIAGGDAARIPELELIEMVRGVRDFAMQHRLVTAGTERAKR